MKSGPTNLVVLICMYAWVMGLTSNTDPSPHFSLTCSKLWNVVEHDSGDVMPMSEWYPCILTSLHQGMDVSISGIVAANM